MDLNAAEGVLLEAVNLHKQYPFIRRARGFPRRLALRAVDGVSFSIDCREIVGLVGESGCGKTTVGKLIAGLQPPTSGEVRYRGTPLPRSFTGRHRQLRRSIQMIFQDPISSLNPRMKVGEVLVEPLLVNRVGTAAERRERVARILEDIGLPPDSVRRYPHEFSGGQRQRIGIGRALVLDPDLIVADEPVSALDISFQAQILNLMLGLRNKYNISILLIAHDLSVVRAVSERVAVMYLGRIVEIGAAEDLFANPLHPYTWGLLAAVPVPDPEIKVQKPPLAGEPPSPVDVPPYCRFAGRCPREMPVCRTADPSLTPLTPGSAHEVACFLYHSPGENDVST